MRKIKDYYFKKAQKDNYPARSVYKLEEAQKKNNLLSRGNTVLDLGSQPGSWAIYTAQIIGPHGLVVGVDLKEGRDRSQPMAAKIQWLCADVMSFDFADIIKGIRPGFNVVLSDMAPSTSGNKWVDQQRTLRLAKRALEIADAVLFEQGNFFCKAFQGEDFPEFVDQVRTRYHKVKVVKPKSSRTESREVFVLGMGYVGRDI